jgi:hypothetical protein
MGLTEVRRYSGTAMPQFRVTKYDPAHRDPAGAFLLEDWTSFSDVGQTFAGVRLTQETYEVTEDAYIESALAFLQEAGTTYLYVRGLEAKHTVDAPLEGTALLANDIAPVLRGLLREQYWCRLEAESAFVHVGWDFYMYVGVPSPCLAAEASAHAKGLFVEAFPSPYATSAA